VTWRLFKPKTTFYAPSSSAVTILNIILIAILFVLWLLTKTDVISATVAEDIPSIYVAFILIEGHGRAIWHHIENATRTPRDLWAAFFGS